jgi:hypothetical protein
MEKILKKTIPEMLEYFEDYDKYDIEKTWAEKAKQFRLKKGKGTWKKACEMFIDDLCEECNDARGRMNDLYEVLLCPECNKLEDYATICKTTAKNKYFLKDEDLEDLDYIETKNKFYRSGSMMKLYCLADVIKIFKKKYHVKSGDDYEDVLEELKEQKEEKSKMLLKNKQKKKNIRKKELVEALEEKGLEFRADSKLCEKYINGGTLKNSQYKDLFAIVKRMCQMKFLYDYCDMDKAFKIAKNEQRHEMHEGHYHGEPLHELAEEYALEEKGGYPKKWPWL